MSRLISIFRERVYKKIFKTKVLNDQFKKGYEEFLKTGKTSQEANLAMINLYCKSNGRFTDELHKKDVAANPKVLKLTEINGVLGKLDKKQFDSLNETLKKDGYVSFDKKLSPDIVKKLYEYALKTPALAAPKYDKKIVYEENKPVSEIYRFDMQDLVNNPEIQELIMDETLINIARNYLDSEPIFDFPAMWWSTSFLKVASSEAAQLYHFDMDRIKWLKIFIYLNDVTMENGPHSYIKGSHVTGSKPQYLLNRGYVRISDEELSKEYKKDDFITICADAGSVFAGDTKCWHKGTPLKKGHRLVLEFEYTTSMFGSQYPKFEIKQCSDAFKKFCEENKRYASNFNFSK